MTEVVHPEQLIPLERIESKILLIRGQKVMLSTHLAELYDVEPRALVQAVKRNADRFPADFMFQLNSAEFQHLKSQIVTSSWGGLRRATPYAFTEQGVAMLSSVLKSQRAIQVNIAIIRAFVRLRQVLAEHQELAERFRNWKSEWTRTPLTSTRSLCSSNSYWSHPRSPPKEPSASQWLSKP
jgi:hypothetical protein